MFKNLLTSKIKRLNHLKKEARNLKSLTRKKIRQSLNIQKPFQS